MRTIFTRQFLLFFIFSFLYVVITDAQQWRWGKKGGSTDDAGGRYEYLSDMATDANGNVYAIATVAYGGMNVNNTPRTGYGNEDIMLASFTCDGTLRWSKIIGAGRGDYAYTVKTDKQGGIYIACIIDLNLGTLTGKIDADATIPPSNKTFYLIKYDTSGNYQWYLSPQADTVSMAAFSYTAPLSMDIDKNDNVHILCLLPPGEFGGPGGFVATNLGLYMLQYNTTGNFISGNSIDMYAEGTSRRYMSFKINPRNGNYYVAGRNYDKITIGGNIISGYSYLACFNSNGQLQWYKEPSGNAGFAQQFAIDENSNIFLTGGCSDGSSFGSYTFSGLTNSDHPFAMMTDSTGNVIWASVGNDAAQIGGTCVALRSSGEVVIGGTHVGLLSWPGRTETFEAGAEYHSFIARFARNGKILQLDELYSTNGDATPEHMISDGRDNIFIGGYFEAEMKVNGQNLYSTGGEADWWFAKYGYDCNCTYIPEPNFSFTRNGYDLSFNYTGSSNYTSIEWDFGDGTTATGASASHTYPANSYQAVCVKVANDCGDNIYCENIPLWPTSITNISNEDGVSIYPNPVNDVLHIDGIKTGTSIQLIDVTGRTVYQATSLESKATINIADLPPGNYIVQLTDKAGNRAIRKVVKG